MISPYSTRLPIPPALSAGTDFSLFLHEDGSVYATGTNQYGQLGLGHTQDQIVPVLNTLLTGIRAISAGAQHSLILDSKGRVWGCGDNSSGQLGLGPEIDQQIIPTIIPGFDHLPIIFISAGHDYSLVIDQLGRVWGFGSNDMGQLGSTPSDDPQETPQLIPGLSGIIAVSAGSNHSLFLDRQGQVWGTGDNSKGQLGLGSTVVGSTPVESTGLTLTSLKLPQSKSAPLKSKHESFPNLIPGLPRIKMIAAGLGHSLLLDESGQVWGFGSNEYGQLGLGDYEDRDIPVMIDNLPPMGAIQAGANFSLIQMISGPVWSFGLNYHGQLGYPTNPREFTRRNIPTLISGLPRVKLISAGSDFGLAMDDQGLVWGFGSNDEGQLGQGSVASSTREGQGSVASSTHESQGISSVAPEPPGIEQLDDYVHPTLIPGLSLRPQAISTTYALFEQLFKLDQIKSSHLRETDKMNLNGGEAQLEFIDRQDQGYLAQVEYQPQIYPSTVQTEETLFRQIEIMILSGRLQTFQLRPDIPFKPEQTGQTEQPGQLEVSWAEFTDNQHNRYLFPIRYDPKTNQIFSLTS